LAIRAARARIDPVKKRTAALLFLFVVAGMILAALLVLRTRWAGDRICSAAAVRVAASSGLHFTFRACEIDPFRLAIRAEGIALGPPGRPVFAAEEVSAGLAAVQALDRQIHLDRVRLVRPRLVVSMEARSGEVGQGATVCPPELLSRFEIRHLEVEGGAADVALPGFRAQVAGLEVRSRPSPRSLRTLGRPARRVRFELGAGQVNLAVRGRHFHAERLALEGELAPDLSSLELARAEADVGGARLGLAGRVEDLCDPRIDLTATADGPVAALLGLAGLGADVEGSARISAHFAGRPASPAVSGTVRTRAVRVGRYRPGDTTTDLRLAGDTLVVERLAIPASGAEVVARGTLRLARGLPLAAEVDLGGVDLAEILDRLGVRDPWITLRLDGKGRVSGTLSPPKLGGSIDLGLRGLKALTRSYRAGAADPGVVAFDQGQIEAQVRVDREGLFLDGARLAVGRGALQADAAIHFSGSKGFWVRARGDADLDALGRVASIPWAGLFSLEASVAAAPYGEPHIEGRGRVAGFRFLDIDLGAAAADITYGASRLHLSAVEGVRGATRYRGDAVVDLRRTPAHVISSRFQARGRLRDMFDAVVDWLPRTRYVRDLMDGDVEVRGTASGPAAGLDAAFESQLGPGTLLGRRYESGRATGRILRGEEVRFERAELRRGTGVAQAQGSWGFVAPFAWELQLSAAGVPLELPGRGWAGTASGSAALAGSYEHPRVRFAANGAGVAMQGVRLGAVQAGGTLTERRLVLTAGAEELELAAEASLDGRGPFRARATVALEDAARLLQGGRSAGFRLRVKGEAEAAGELADWRQARVSATLSQLTLGYADVRVEARAPVRLEAARGRWELSPLTLEGANTSLTVAGTLAPSGDLDVLASGALDMRLAAGLVPSVHRAYGQLALEAHLGGKTGDPVLVGSGRVADAGFQLRGFTAAFTGMSGALAFSQNRILFDRLDATLNGGRARFQGEVELARLVPVRLKVEGHLDEVPVAVPAYLPATLSGRIEAAGTPEATTLAGRLHVTRARYTADVDLEGSLLELRRRPPPPPRAYDRAGEWLRFDLQLAVDGDVRVENDLVRGPLSGELTLTGTLAAPGLVGTLAMGQGSRAIFRGNEFDLTHAVLDFTDRSRIEIGLDVHGESQVRDYQVLMHVLGSLDKPRMTLTSQPWLPEPDIVTLLSLGFTRRDAGAGGGLGGVAPAAAAQALFSASGLDEQVRRFLPRGGPIRDLSFRITTAYSEQTGEVEPRGEFESWLLRDRLRLRVQTPLGAARGRKAQAELRLGGHTALQYQWDNDNPDVATGDHGVDLKLRWEWADEQR